MKLKGISDFFLGNFLCLRGFAPMGDLHDMEMILITVHTSFREDLEELAEARRVSEEEAMLRWYR